MSPPRPLMHTVHLVTFLALLGSGLLLFMPALRAVVTGGYSLVIREVHCWAGVVFVVLPAAILLRWGPQSVFARPSEQGIRTLWQAAHGVLTIVLSSVFALTGFVLWAKRLTPESLVDGSRMVHDWLTFVAGGLLALHLVDVAMAALVGRVRAVSVAAAEESRG